MRSARRGTGLAVATAAAAALSLLATGSASAATGAATGAGTRTMTGFVDDAGGAPQKAVLTGIPGRDVQSVESAGAVELRTKNGRRQLLTAPYPSTDARFGEVVHDTAVGKLYFNLERYALIGAPGLTVDGQPDAGGVYVFERDQAEVEFVTLLTQADPAVPGEAQAGAEFGSSIDSYAKHDDGGGNLTHVFVGAPGTDVGGADAAGGVVQLDLGRTSDEPTADVTIERAQLHTLLTSDAPGYPDTGDRLGETVLADGPAFYVGAPTATIGGYPEAGFVLFVHTRRQDELLHPGTHGIPGEPYAGGRFGAALDRTTEKLPDAAGPSRELLAIGAPGYQVHYQPGAGKVFVLAKLAGTGVWKFERGFSQDSTDDGTGGLVGGHAESGDGFGSAVLFASRLSKHGRPFLLVGVPGEDVGPIVDAGLVNGLYGLPSQHEENAGGTARAGHRFGSSLGTNTQFHNFWPLDVGYEYQVGVPGAEKGAGAVMFGVGSNNGEIRWYQPWTLYSGYGQTGDAYGGSFDQGDGSS